MPFFSLLILWHTYAYFHLNRASKKEHYLLKNGRNLLKYVLLKLNVQEEGHVYANCLLYILTIYRKWFPFQFLGGNIRMQIPILARVPKRAMRLDP